MGDKSHSSQKEWGVLRPYFQMCSFHFCLSCRLLSSLVGGKSTELKRKKATSDLHQTPSRSIHSKLTFRSKVEASLALLCSVVAFVCHFINKMVYNRVHLSHKEHKLQRHGSEFH